MLSVVLPAHNEADNLAPMLRDGFAALDPLADPLEFVIVDDGSTDRTWAVLEQLAQSDARVRPVRHERNRGYGAALATGLAAARHDLVLLCDADRQFDLADAPAMLEAAEDSDVVAGYRAPRRDPGGRRFIGQTWSRLVGGLYGLGVRDVNCALKLFHRRALESVEIRSRGALVSAEILAQVRGAGHRIAEVPVRHYPRTAGAQSGARADVVLKALLELVQNHRRLRACARPPRGTGSRSRQSSPLR
ncbi:MAG: glycosyltransferase family 2 protein [Proteobacteria bacterium]|nr:glycosyltransferase family 2 protein [Pseudomonadota bacterium]